MSENKLEAKWRECGQFAQDVINSRQERQYFQFHDKNGKLLRTRKMVVNALVAGDVTKKQICEQIELECMKRGHKNYKYFNSARKMRWAKNEMCRRIAQGVKPKVMPRKIQEERKTP